MFKRVLIAFGLGLGAYVVWRGQFGTGYSTASGEGEGFNAVAGDFLNVASYGTGLFEGGNMQISIAGLSAIKGHEGFRPYVYKDSAGRDTIGYGHLIGPLESFSSVTEQEASRLLAQDVATAEAAVNRLVKVPLNQSQFDALVSFVYNVGAGAFSRSTMLRKLNAGDYLGAQTQFTAWIYATVNGKKTVINGLANRRLAEARLFSGATVTA